jgi:hypothetical protein
VIQGDIVVVDANALRYWAAQQGTTGLTLNNQAGVRDGEINNAGTITGNIYLGSGEHVVTNQGVITGNIFVDQNGVGTAIGSREFTLTNLGTLTGSVTIRDVAGATNTITLAGGGFSGNIAATTGAGTNSLILFGSGTLHDVSKFSTLQVGGQASGGGGDDDDDDDNAASPTLGGAGTWMLAPGTTQQFSTGAEVMSGSTLIVDSTLQANVLVDTGATLGGMGTIQGNVTNNGTIQLATTKLTVSGAVDLGPGSVLKTSLSGRGGASANAPSDNAGQLVVGASGTADASAKVVPFINGAPIRSGDWYHQVSPMPGSRNPLDVAPSLSTLPQVHFVASGDRVVPASVAQSFAQRLGPANPCVRIVEVAGTAHSEGWRERWPDLLREQPACRLGQREQRPSDWRVAARAELDGRRKL